MFGELSAFDPGPRSSTATAVTASEIRTLEHEELMGWLTGRPEVAQGLLAQMAAGSVGPTTWSRTWCSPTYRGGWPSSYLSWPSASVTGPTTAYTCTTT